MILITLGVVLIALLIYLVQKAREINRHWERMGLKCLKPTLFFGNSLPVILKRKHLVDIYNELCNVFPDEPILGYYDTMSPRIVVQDPEIIEKILIKDFQHFTDHPIAQADEKRDPINHYQLFTLRGAKWRAYRYKMSPLFTSGKLKNFFEVIEICGEKLIKFLEKNPRDVQLAKVLQSFASDFAGMSIFGFDADVINNPDSDFNKYGTDIFEGSIIKTYLLFMVPKLGQLFRVSMHNKERTDFFCNVIKSAFKYRQETGIKRNDFIQMMMHLKEKGVVEIQNWDTSDNYLRDEVKAPLGSFEITDESLMSQAFTFLTTGLDAVPTALIYAFYELSRHQDIQSKVREEIKKTTMHSGITYDALRTMTYLDNVMNESARLHPLAMAIFRQCTKDYTFPTGYKAKAGDIVHIPIHAVHLNPKNFDNPNEFKPDRFYSPIKPGTYFPFGDGPRICIAMRFAQLQMKYAVAKILTNYNVTLSPKTHLPLELKPHSVIVQPKHSVYFNLTPI